MPHLAKTLSTAVVAALLAGCPVVATAADAHPASAHRHSSTNTHRHSVADKLTGPRRGASHAIGAQLKAVRALVNRAGDLTITDAAALQDALAADAAAVQADLDAVAGGGSVRALHTLMMAANTSRQVARMQFGVVVAADAAAAQADALSATIDGLIGQLVDLDESAGVTALDDALSTLSTVSAQAAGAVTFALLVSPTASRTDLHAAIDDSDAALQSITDDLATVAETVAAIQAEFGL